jgi:small subunit ribosomal protein S1
MTHKSKKTPRFREETTQDNPMVKLLENFEFSIPEVGELVKGKVLEIGKSSIFVDLGILGTGIIMGREMKDGLGIAAGLKKGDEVEATVIEMENEDGYMELSLREAGYEKTWDELERKMKEGETVVTKILAANRGGLMVELNGITGFLPVSQLANENYPRVEDGDKNKILQLLNKFIEQSMNVRVIDVDRIEEKLIVSEKATSLEREEMELRKFKVGDTVEGLVSGIVDFGVFVKFPPQGQDIKSVSPKDMLEGLIHISELAWQLIDNPRDIVKIGEKVNCKIIGIDNNRISFSMRALKRDPWNKVEERYKSGDIIEGEITKLNPFGAFVQLDKDIHGLAHISELNRFAKGRNLEEILKVGSTYQFKVLSVEPKNHRMGLAPFSKEEEEKIAKEEKKTKKEKESTKEITDSKEEKQAIIEKP